MVWVSSPYVFLLMLGLAIPVSIVVEACLRCYRETREAAEEKPPGSFALVLQPDGSAASARHVV